METFEEWHSCTCSFPAVRHLFRCHRDVEEKPQGMLELTRQTDPFKTFFHCPFVHRRCGEVTHLFNSEDLEQMKEVFSKSSAFRKLLPEISSKAFMFLFMYFRILDLR